MGSTGSSKFGDYKASSTDKCEKEIETDLEEVANSEFYGVNKDVPKVGTPIALLSKPYKSRLVIQESKTGKEIGLLPTKYNYLIVCIKKEYSYAGEVLSSGNGKVPRVRIKLGSA
jgi:hypothetical protein